MPRKPQLCGFGLVLPTKLVATATSLDGPKTNFTSFIYSHSSANPANLVNVGLVDVEKIGLTEIVRKETAAKHKNIPHDIFSTVVLLTRPVLTHSTRQ